MVNIKFGSSYSPHSLGFVEAVRDLDTIYIPTTALKAVKKMIEDAYIMSPEQLQKAAEVYLEEYYPEVLAHEAAHLALGRIAQKEGQPTRLYVMGYHNPIVDKIEDMVHRKAVAKALESVQGVSHG